MQFTGAITLQKKNKSLYVESEKLKFPRCSSLLDTSLLLADTGPPHVETLLDHYKFFASTYFLLLFVQFRNMTSEGIAATKKAAKKKAAEEMLEMVHGKV